jgi:hypothetical protein
LNIIFVENISNMAKTNFLIISCVLFATLASTKTQAGDPLFPNSVVSNEIDFILDTDPDEFTSLAFIGLEDKEMPGNGSNLFDEDTFVFEATFSNGKIVGIWCHSSFVTLESAQEYAEKLCPRLGKLPFVQRDMLDHVCINVGNQNAFAETQGHFFVLYSGNMDERISTHDLEETVFHESVHASIQDIYENDTAWTNAQAADPSFVTYYAQSYPHLEDMPESALFAYTLLTYPGRLDADIEAWLIENIPNRIAFFANIYPVTATGINKEVNKFNMLSYPNPTDGILTVMLNGVSQGAYIEVLSISGTLIKSAIAQRGENILNLEDLANGVYFLSVPGYKTSRIIKQ